MAKVLVPLSEGFEDIEAVTIIDVLRRGGVEVVTAAIGDSREVEAAHGITMRADARFADVGNDDYDAIILPGGGKGTQNLKACEALTERLKRQKESGKWLCAICAAPTVLVAAEVLDPDVHVTCYPSCRSELDREWSPAPVVVDGKVITGQAPGSALLFALIVLQELVDPVVAGKVAIGLVTDVLG